MFFTSQIKQSIVSFILIGKKLKFSRLRHYIQVQAAAGRTQQEDLSGAFLQMVNEANQNVKIRNLRRFAWLIEALGGALVGLQ